MTGPSLYDGVNDTEIIPATGSIVVALAKDPTLYQNLLSALPTQAQLEEVHERYKASYNAVLAGNHGKAPERDADRRELNRRFSRFAGLVKLAAEEDPTLLAKLGIAPHKQKRSSTTIHLTAPTNFQVRHGEEHGVMIGRAGGVKGARSYIIEACEGNPTVEQNWRYIATSVRSTRMDMRGLVPGTVYSFRVRGVGANGPGPWSSYVTLMAI